MSNNAYQSLEKLSYRLTQLGHLGSVAHWDQATFMPAGGAGSRGKALAELSVLSHELITRPEVADWLNEAEQAKASLDDWQQANLFEMRREWRQATAVPAELVEAKSLAASKCEHAWRTLRGENNWTDFEPLLEEIVKLTREEADARLSAAGLNADKAKRYDVQLDRFEPGMTSAELEPIFERLKQTLPGMISQIVERQKATPISQLPQTVETAKQQSLAKEVIGQLGFDFNHGRLDVSAHPFCGGVPQDVRITSRYNEADFTEGLFGVIHETGHASYERGLPQKWQDQPVGRARSMGIHESQSLLFEMQVALSQPFIEFLQPKLVGQFGEHAGLSVENLSRRMNRVQPGLIRVNADEVTYPLHVILRYEIEQALLQETIEARDVPALWNEKMQAYLGLSTEGNFKDGPMQDIHWCFGEMGYFPTYSLGAMNAAQIFSTLKRELPEVDSQIARGEFAPMREWLGNKIWSQGSKLSTQDLMRQATGETLNPDYFLQHLQRRYLG